MPTIILLSVTRRCDIGSRVKHKIRLSNVAPFSGTGNYVFIFGNIEIRIIFLMQVSKFLSMRMLINCIYDILKYIVIRKNFDNSENFGNWKFSAWNDYSSSHKLSLKNFFLHEIYLSLRDLNIIPISLVFKYNIINYGFCHPESLIIYLSKLLLHLLTFTSLVIIFFFFNIL